MESKINVLDKGYVRLVDTLGTDLSIVMLHVYRTIRNLQSLPPEMQNSLIFSSVRVTRHHFVTLRSRLRSMHHSSQHVSGGSMLQVLHMQMIRMAGMSHHVATLRRTKSSISLAHLLGVVSQRTASRVAESLFILVMVLIILTSFVSLSLMA